MAEIIKEYILDPEVQRKKILEERKRLQDSYEQYIQMTNQFLAESKSRRMKIRQNMNK